MRLFIAINFSEEIKNRLFDAIGELKRNSLRGNFTNRDNLHLTLVFIGETMEADKIITAINEVKAEPFLLRIGGLGKFRRDGGDIYWVGVEKSGELLQIYNQLYSELTEAGFRLEAREYKPHLTLGREVVPAEGFDRISFDKTVGTMEMRVPAISLMKSERISGKLVYTEIYRKTL
jgi:2'-5' RNA ligase